MKCIIAGSRTITDYQIVKGAFLLSGFALKVTEIVSGHAARTQKNGTWVDNVDRLGEKLAVELHLKLKVMPAEWEKYGPQAGHIRNREMAKYAGYGHYLVAVWDGKSHGTHGMIVAAKAQGLHVYVREVRV
jgi:hypothetical protein